MICMILWLEYQCMFFLGLRNHVHREGKGILVEGVYLEGTVFSFIVESGIYFFTQFLDHS